MKSLSVRFFVACWNIRQPYLDTDSPLQHPLPQALISSNCFESFPPLSNVWIDWRLTPAGDVITTWKPGSDFDWLIV